MKYLFFLLFTSTYFFAQENSSMMKLFKITRIIKSEEIINEADSLGIKADRVIVAFEISADCKIENFKIKRFSKLKSFNEAVLKNSDKIVEDLFNQIDCPQDECKSYLLPITIRFETFSEN